MDRKEPADEGPQHPLVTIRFLGGDAELVATRYWYHVPQTGDLVLIDGQMWFCAGVTWSDDCIRIYVEEVR